MIAIHIGSGSPGLSREEHTALFAQYDRQLVERGRERDAAAQRALAALPVIAAKLRRE